MRSLTDFRGEVATTRFCIAQVTTVGQAFPQVGPRDSGLSNYWILFYDAIEARGSSVFPRGILSERSVTRVDLVD